MKRVPEIDLDDIEELTGTPGMINLEQDDEGDELTLQELLDLLDGQQ